MWVTGKEALRASPSEQNLAALGHPPAAFLHRASTAPTTPSVTAEAGLGITRMICVGPQGSLLRKEVEASALSGHFHRRRV